MSSLSPPFFKELFLFCPGRQARGEAERLEAGAAGSRGGGMCWATSPAHAQQTTGLGLELGDRQAAGAGHSARGGVLRLKRRGIAKDRD